MITMKRTDHSYRFLERWDPHFRWDTPKTLCVWYRRVAALSVFLTAMGVVSGVAVGFVVLYPLIGLVLTMTGLHVTLGMTAGMVFWAVILSVAALIGLVILLSRRTAKALGAAQDGSVLATIVEVGRGVKNRYCPMIRVED